MELGAE